MSQQKVKTGRVSYASKKSQWKAYERLPPSVRAALQQSAFDWASYPIWQRFERGEISSNNLVREIARWDAEQTAKDRKRVWGL